MRSHKVVFDEPFGEIAVETFVVGVVFRGMGTTPVLLNLQIVACSLKELLKLSSVVVPYSGVDEYIYLTRVLYRSMLCVVVFLLFM